MKHRFLYALALGTTAVAVSSPAHAQLGIGAEKSASKAGFALPATGPLRIVVFRPDMQVGSQSTAGLDEPNADWTERAREHMTAALQRNLVGKTADMVLMPEVEGEQGRVLADYRALFRTVTGAVIQHKLFGSDRLPTKRGRFDWTLGPSVARLGEIAGGDFGLFLFTHDSYGSTGRKVLQVLGVLVGGGFTPSGVHIGYAGLVDLKTGDLVWINADTQMGGDVRTVEGADKRIAQLLEDFPQRGAAPAPDDAVVIKEEAE